MKNLCLIIFFLGLAACQSQVDDLPASTMIDGIDLELTAEVIKGFGISPEGFPASYETFGEFLQEVATVPNGAVMYNGAWRNDIEGGTDSGDIPETAAAIMVQAANFNYTPIIVFGWRTDESDLHLSSPENPIDNWTNVEAREKFGAMLVNFAQTYHPPFLFLGNESDAYYISNPEDYARWIEFYDFAYALIKTVSPETQVGPIFQFDRMSGQALLNGWTEAHWGALESHNLNYVDLIGITLYPWFSYATPDEIPDDYLQPLIDRIGELPIAITETGWPADALGADLPWEASPDLQVSYISAINRMVNGLDLKMLNWLHLYPMQPIENNPVYWQAFGSLALYNHDGKPLPIYELWLAYQP